jgi:hypothetical protein
MPPLHHSTTPPLHYSITPLVHYSTAPPTFSCLHPQLQNRRRPRCHRASCCARRTIQANIVYLRLTLSLNRFDASVQRLHSASLCLESLAIPTTTAEDGHLQTAVVQCWSHPAKGGTGSVPSHFFLCQTKKRRRVGRHGGRPSLSVRVKSLSLLSPTSECEMLRQLWKRTPSRLQWNLSLRLTILPL